MDNRLQFFHNRDRVVEMQDLPSKRYQRTNHILLIDRTRALQCFLGLVVADKSRDFLSHSYPKKGFFVRTVYVYDAKAFELCFPSIAFVDVTRTAGEANKISTLNPSRSL